MLTVGRGCGRSGGVGGCRRGPACALSELKHGFDGVRSGDRVPSVGCHRRWQRRPQQPVGRVAARAVAGGLGTGGGSSRRSQVSVSLFYLQIILFSIGMCIIVGV